MILSFVLIILGFVLLIKGADWLVNGATALARKYHVSDLAIGLTVVAFGTSAPELVVNSVASINNLPDIVLGNVIGSNNFNLFVILGVAGLILPIKVQSNTAWRQIPVSLLVVLLCLALCNNFFLGGEAVFSTIDALIFLAGFAAFLYYVYAQMKTETDRTTTPDQQSNLRTWAEIVFGLAGLIIGGKLVVDNSVTIATQLGVSEKIIGLTIVAFGTSLPELVTSVVAATRKKADIIIGNVIGSNIFNMLLILPLSALIRPIPFNTNFNTDLYLLAGGTLILFAAMLTGRRRKLDRWEAGILLAVYLAYTVFLVAKEL
ncbi:MAG: calcium/sodium antiporter [Mangrovibacterium sp.]